MDLFTIPSLSGGKSGQKKKAKRVENRIDQNFMWELKQFYNENDCIKSCRKKKIESLVQHKASISWWFTKEVELAEIPVMNSETYLRALHDLLWCANDYLTLFGFVGFYIRKDIGEWVKDKEKHGGLLPFGVIEFGERKDQIPGYFVKRAKKSTIFGSEIVFNCTDDSKKLKYTFFVMDKNATFRIPITTNNNNNNDFYPTEDSNSSNIIPNSSFEALFDKWRRIVEVVITLDDANAQSCRPEPFLLTKPLPETDITQTSESDRYLSNFLDEIGTEVALDKLQSGYEYASSHSQRMKCQTAYTQLQSMRYGGRKYVSMTEQRRMAFPHPTLTENLEVLPPMVTLDRGPPPKSLIDLNHLEETYEAQVCSVMCYPYLLFKSHSHSHSQSNKLKGGGGGGGISNDSQKQAAEMELDKITQSQEALFQEIFTELYMRSYAFLDLETLSHIPQTYDPSFQFLLEGINVRLIYNHQSPKTDLDIQNLSMLLNNGIISDKELRSQLVRYGISEEVDGVLRKPENSENKPKAKSKEKKVEKVKKVEKKKKKESSESSSEEEEKKKKKEGESEEKEKLEKTKEKKKKKESSKSGSEEEEKKEKKKKKKKREESNEASTEEEKEERPKKKAKKD